MACASVCHQPTRPHARGHISICASLYYHLNDGKTGATWYVAYVYGVRALSLKFCEPSVVVQTHNDIGLTRGCFDARTYAIGGRKAHGEPSQRAVQCRSHPPASGLGNIIISISLAGALLLLSVSPVLRVTF